MRVVVVRAFGPYSVGFELDPPPGHASVLINQGYVRAVEDQPAGLVPAPPTPAAVASQEPPGGRSPKGGRRQRRGQA